MIHGREATTSAVAEAATAVVAVAVAAAEAATAVVAVAVAAPD